MSIVEAFAGKRANGRRDPEVPPIQQAVVEAFAPPEIRQSRYGEEAARAAQYVSDLEGKVGRLESVVNTQQSHIRVVEESNNLLHEEIKYLIERNDRLNYVNSVIETRLHVATDVILGIKAVIPPRDDAHESAQPIPDAALKTVIEAVDKELNSVDAALAEKPKDQAAS